MRQRKICPCAFHCARRDGAVWACFVSRAWARVRAPRALRAPCPPSPSRLERRVRATGRRALPCVRRGARRRPTSNFGLGARLRVAGRHASRGPVTDRSHKKHTLHSPDIGSRARQPMCRCGMSPTLLSHICTVVYICVNSPPLHILGYGPCIKEALLTRPPAPLSALRPRGLWPSSIRSLPGLALRQSLSRALALAEATPAACRLTVPAPFATRIRYVP